MTAALAPATALAPPLDRDEAAAHAEPRTIEVFVHLARDKDVVAWREARAAGTLVGTNDETPYGYGRAERMGCRLAYSRSRPESALARLVRLGARAILGFDIVHALRQRQALLAADIVWTHTESQYLAVAAILALAGRGAKTPKLLGQSIWLFDRWSSLPSIQKWLFRRLIDHVDILTVHSVENLAVARKLFPDKRIELVPFGIPSEAMTAPVTRGSRPIRILAPGSDRHRDWDTLALALDGLEDARALILSGTAPQRIARNRPNLTIAKAASQGELVTHLAEATMVCVPLAPNLHASGITVIQEAVLAGVPVIASETGGLTGYFARDGVRYVSPGDVAALREAILALAQDPDAARQMAERAQARMAAGSPSAEAFVRQHVEISRTLIDR